MFLFYSLRGTNHLNNQIGHILNVFSVIIVYVKQKTLIYINITCHKLEKKTYCIWYI